MTRVPAGVPPAMAAALTTRTPWLWLNPSRSVDVPPVVDAGFDEAEDRLRRAAKLLARLFPELASEAVAVESPLRPAPRLQAALGLDAAEGRLLVKADHLLPIAGSIKARGGFHEVLAHAESLALASGLIAPGADLVALTEAPARELFERRSIAVGSTGNLGLSIGILGAALGFRAAVHMSRDAKAWKKDALRRRGAQVVEHAGDYAQAVAAGRAEALADPASYFVDDESSKLLLDGYAAAARPLAAQLAAAGRTPSAGRPLLVYLPCGVGGAPGGIALGLARLFGPHVHCFFAEPVASPCMLLKLAVGGDVSVYDWGLDNRTEADGLAVPRASSLVAERIAEIVSGIFTVTDEQLFGALLQAWRCEELEIEPSAGAGFAGPQWLASSAAGQQYVERTGLRLADATHVLWTTGGALVPTEEHRCFRARATELEAAGRVAARKP